MNEKTNCEVDQWLTEHGPVLYRYALMHLRDSHKAEDAVQETLLAALQARTGFSGGATERTWLFGILKHKIIDQFRRDAREVPLNEPETVADQDTGGEDDFTEAGDWRNRPASWGDPEQMLESRQFWQIFELCLEYLPERQARLFMLREVMENSSEEICQELCITSTNLWTMLHRARLVLRQCLEKNGIAKIKSVK
ncbi:MAG: sigma-70 family RNA polymerase sigma factor [Sulfuriferula sp.]